MASFSYLGSTSKTASKTENQNLSMGDEIAVVGEAVGEVYYHHAIFVSPDEVYDFGGVGDGTVKESGIINKRSLKEFTQNGIRRMVKIEHPEGKSLMPEKVVDNARFLFKNPRFWGEYNVMTNNCEHFSSKCKTGYAHSAQVINRIKTSIYKVLTGDIKEIFKIICHLKKIFSPRTIAVQ